MKRPARITGAFALVALALLASALPASALTVKGQGWYARFDMGGGSGGIAIVDKVQGTNGRLNALFVGLLASEEYAIIGRSIDCDGTPAPGNRKFRVRRLSDAGGNVHVSPLQLQNVMVSSIWVGRTDGSEPATCAISFNFERMQVATGDVNSDGSLSIANHEFGHWIVVAETLPNDEARVSIVVNGLNGNDTISFIGSKKPCGQPSSGPANAYKVTLQDALVTSYSIHDIHMNQGNANALRSVRMRNETQAKNLGCGPSSLMALLLP